MFWVKYQSWSFVLNVVSFLAKKLLRTSRQCKPTHWEMQCTCHKGVYVVPSVDDVALILRKPSEEEMHILRPLTFNATSPDASVAIASRPILFYLLGLRPWSKTRFQMTKTQQWKKKLQRGIQLSYGQLLVHLQEVRDHATRKSTTAVSVDECALWPSLYFNMCESGVYTYTLAASGKLVYMHITSPVYHYALNFELLQYNYDRWLFKTITGATNPSWTSGCSPNRGLQDKSFLVKF